MRALRSVHLHRGLELGVGRGLRRSVHPRDLEVLLELLRQLGS